MPIEAGQQLLHYSIVEKIGEGGMGAVWRATDTTLHRDVAIKVLPQLLAGDADRLARFEREAKLLASLNHPNIAAIYGLHHDAETHFLAMELVDGEDLQQRLARGPLSVERSLNVALQMATGIEAAHEKGVVHRDLKPANVIVTPDDEVKLLDFGLAKGFETDTGSSDPSLSPTMTSAGTVAGMILGTAAYMSPEQARGKTVDRRTDLWAFGCVLYECLTGTRLFDGETISDSLAAVLRKEPDWSLLPEETPPMVRLMLRRCLERHRSKRLRDAGDARLELEQAIEDPRPEALGLSVAGSTASGDIGGDAGKSGASRLAWAVAAIALAAAAFFALRGPGQAAPAGADVSRRLAVQLPGSTDFGDNRGSPPVISPDGRFIVFGIIDDESDLLWLRPVDNFEARPLPGTEGARFAFWSPDSRYLGFFRAGRLRRLEVATGRVQPIGGGGSSFPRGASWNSAGQILFAPNSNAGIYLIDAAGGEPRQITTPDPEIPDSSHRWPCFLPDGDHFVFLLWTNEPQAKDEHAGIYISSISGGEPPVRLLSDASSVVYAAPGYLLVMQEQNLIAVPFDADSRSVTGEARVIASGVLRQPSNGYAAFTASQEGTLVYAGGQALLPADLRWYDRSGKPADSGVEAAPFSDLRLSPDARRAAVVLPGPTGDGEVWIVDLARGVRTRVEAGGWSYAEPRWSHDGRHVLYTSSRQGQNDLYLRAADGSGVEEPVMVDTMDKSLWDWSRDGRHVAYWPIGSGSGTPDVWLYSLDDKQSRPLIAGETAYSAARFSPDGRFIVYVSEETGREEVFAQALDGGARWQVSTAGGDGPRWSDDGSEIVYIAPGRKVMAVPVKPDASGLTLGAPEELFTFTGKLVAADATGDHRRFLAASRTDVASEPLHVILDWAAGL